MIVDPSALLAIVQGEAGAEALEERLLAATSGRLSAPGYVELMAVVDGRRDPVVATAMERLLVSARIEVVPFTPQQARLARDAYQRFGRGSGHPARLNMGDCFSYALARDLHEPLLFAGRDFALTDIELLVEPIRERRLSEAMAPYTTGAGSA